MQENVRNFMELVLKTKRRGCMTTLVGHNESAKLELLRAWEPLDSSRPSQTYEGTSSQGVFANGDSLK